MDIIPIHLPFSRIAFDALSDSFQFNIGSNNVVFVIPLPQAAESTPGLRRATATSLHRRSDRDLNAPMGPLSAGAGPGSRAAAVGEGGPRPNRRRITTGCLLIAAVRPAWLVAGTDAGKGRPCIQFNSSSLAVALRSTRHRDPSMDIAGKRGHGISDVINQPSNTTATCGTISKSRWAVVTAVIKRGPRG